MLNNCEYDKIKLLHKFSCMLWFIKHHAKEDAKQAGDDAALKLFEDLEKDIGAHISMLQKQVCK